MHPKTVRSLRAVVDYLYNDEQRHFEEDASPSDHIFRDVQTLAEWLEENEPTT